jgi:hypothetical protein
MTASMPMWIHADRQKIDETGDPFLERFMVLLPEFQLFFRMTPAITR